MRVLVIIPAYNEEKSIGAVYQGVRAACPYVDCLVVNDGSSDGTGRVIRQMGIPYLELPVNMGIGVCVQTGYRFARDHGYDIAIQLDGDGQHDPSYLPALINPIQEGRAHFVVGSRFIDKQGFQSTAARRAGIALLRWTLRLTAELRIQDATSGLRACSSELIDYFADHYAEDYPEAEALMAANLLGYRILEVPVVMKERRQGRSSIQGLKSMTYMMKVVLALAINSLRFRAQRRRQSHED